MRISLSSASLATSTRKFSGLSSRNSPPSLTRPMTWLRAPEIMVISPVNPPGSCNAIIRSPSRDGCTISIRPESST